mgnify:CR=1 FL=1
MNREQWLIAAADKLSAVVFSSEIVPANIRYSCGWPGGGSKNSRIGECWYPGASADASHEIFISPTIADAVRVLDILAHEMIHAICGPEAGHKGPFKRVALKIGLTGKMTATTAGPELLETLESIASDLGEYPHAEMSTSGKKKQTTRMIKAECACGYTIRLSRTWAQLVGATCPDHGDMPIDL